MWSTQGKLLLVIIIPLLRKNGILFSLLYFTLLFSVLRLLPTCSIQALSTSAVPEDEFVDASSAKWLRFNDNLVDEFTMSEASLEAECFGGSYKAKANDGES